MSRSLVILALLFSIRIVRRRPSGRWSIFGRIPGRTAEKRSGWSAARESSIAPFRTCISHPHGVLARRKGAATGAAVVIAPGGGFTHLAIDKEGYDVAKWLNQIGVAGFVLKYRLPNTKGVGYTIDTSLADTLRAVRIVRSRAKEWGIDPNRVGMMGFSAGGALAALAGTKYDARPSGATDAIDEQSARPDFLIIGYGAIPADAIVTAKTPPAFLVHADDDRLSAEQSANFYSALKKAGRLRRTARLRKGRARVRHREQRTARSQNGRSCARTGWRAKASCATGRSTRMPARRRCSMAVISPGEWSDATEFFGVRDWVPQFSPTDDPKDLSLHGYVKHDGKRLYFAFDVTDDVLYGIDTPRWLPEAKSQGARADARGLPLVRRRDGAAHQRGQSLDWRGAGGGRRIVVADGVQSDQVAERAGSARAGCSKASRAARRRPGTRTRSGFSPARRKRWRNRSRVARDTLSNGR